ncbi:maleylacetate reductase [Nonomuraea soli]|uniref:Alcohol dehydrogenase class IV n=1 Tax=Nonomuraea soli TaxID=1032476 RepID=A0A7W0CV27_9ACTN|nr:maleylacetate reductase [Nonomuraea soli]MBA2897710.1 alcohol dehydrogenase class IV [Nonomuraea soli]
MTLLPNTAFTHTALPGRVVFGRGTARTALAAELDALQARRILLIAGPAEAALARELCAPFADRIAATFTEVRPHVPLEAAERARQAAAGADAVLSIGGGSTTGTAKAVALTTGLPIAAVPTTYAGSEVTPVWGLTQDGRKTTGTDPRVLPRTVVYDPDLTLTLPVPLSAASGLNAMAHCVEAFWAPHRSPVSSAVAAEGIRALAAGLPAVATDPTDLAARTDLLLGAYLAGTAFAAAGSGLHHKICHVLGGAFDLPHAETHAIVLPHVLAFNAPAAPDALARISIAYGRPDPAAGLHDLGLRLGLPTGLRELGLREDDLDTVLDGILAVVPSDNPRPVTAAGLRTLLHAAWAGAHPHGEETTS